MSGPSLVSSAAAAAHGHHHYSSEQGHSRPDPTAAELTHHQNADPKDTDPPPTILTFSDVPTDLLQLGPSIYIPPQQEEQQQSQSPPSNSSLPAIKRSNSIHQPRKPSPGLAARLKALGFGASPRQSSPPPPPSNNEVGRLPEDQLRQLDKNHLANSSGSVVERRGRPWKGAGAPLQVLRSKSSRSSLRKRDDEDQDIPESDTVSLTTKIDLFPGITAPLKLLRSKSSRSSLKSINKKKVEDEAPPEPIPKLDPTPELPVITATSPLDMDTNKYRLPDHTNGNGTKALSDTRREHLERADSQPPPPPLPKDTPPGGAAPAEFNPDASYPYFNPLGLQRPGSIYTISRASFASQLAQLTSLQLPDADLLSSKVSAIPTAQAASKALINAAEQIRMWISKASEVIGGLDSEDDVEWAAAGGREGYEEVENAIMRFEELINVYVSAIEELQSRGDIASVSGDDLQRAVTQMECILDEWAKIRYTLRTAKEQIETAMEWEELWNTVLGEIQNEMDELSRLVFEMEERRHRSLMAAANGDGVDIGDLETIVEEAPPAARNNRFSLPAFPLSPESPATPSLSQDDSSLLALFARMQPLRASLDFLPMRLSVFEHRAEKAFPTACEELDERKEALEAGYKKLEKDAESLRKELGEDKWVLVFRGAGRQAQKMHESVDRSVAKLREAIDSGMHLTNPAVMSKKIESYEAKKMHYGPAIERVLSIIEKGVKERLTVNGEIVRLHTDMLAKWEGVKDEMRELDVTLDDIQSDKRGGQALRDSISSMLSNDMSTIGSGNETPGSSPPSSVVMSSLGLELITPSATKKTRSASMGSNLPKPSNARRSGLIPPSQLSQLPRKPVGSRLSTLSNPSSNLSTPPRSASCTLVSNRPRWNTSFNTRDSDLGHNFKPLTLTTPSPYAKRSPTPIRSASSLTPQSQGSKIPMLRSPLGRESSTSPIPEDTPSRTSTSRLAFRDRITAASSGPGPYAQQLQTKPRLLTSQSSMSALANNRRSLQPPRPESQVFDTRQRSASSLASTRRVSMLPQPKAKPGETSGRASPQPIAGARMTMRKFSNAADPKPKDNKPRWHY